MRRRNLIIVGFVVLVLGVFGFEFFSKIHYVDPKPALALGDDYFSDLRQGQTDDAFQMYTDGFLRKVGEEWRNVITQVDAQGGVRRGFQGNRISRCARHVTRQNRNSLCSRSVSDHQENAQFRREVDCMPAPTRSGMGDSRSRDHSEGHWAALLRRDHRNGKDNCGHELAKFVPGLLPHGV